jgi:hypothetical protein
MATPDRNPEPASTPDQQSTPTSGEQSNFVLVPEEIDSTKLRMPPWTPIGIVLLVIFIGMGIAAYVTRPQPKATGTIEEVYAVALPENNVMVTMKVNIKNVGGKALWIRDLKVKLVTDKGEFSDEAANAVDFPRYFSGFPDIRQHTIAPVKVEDKIDPGSQERGSIISSFPVSLDEFNARKSISVIIGPYDQAPITITK